MRRVTLVAPLLGLCASPALGQWQSQAVDTKSDFRGLCVVSADVAWASGTMETFARTTDRGKTWSVGTVPGAEKPDFRDVKAFGADVAYLLSAGPGDADDVAAGVDDRPAGVAGVHAAIDLDPGQGAVRALPQAGDRRGANGDVAADLLAEREAGPVDRLRFLEVFRRGHRQPGEGVGLGGRHLSSQRPHPERRFNGLPGAYRCNGSGLNLRRPDVGSKGKSSATCAGKQLVIATL
jgi:hypothetical protein